jgi:hypothetical protein
MLLHMTGTLIRLTTRQLGDAMNVKSASMQEGLFDDNEQ